MDTLDCYFLTFLVIAFGFLVLPNLDRDKLWARALVIGLLAILWARYMDWRLFSTTLPVPMITGMGLWIWLSFGVEILTSIETFIFYFTMMRHTNRSAQADKYEAELRLLPPEELPTVDLYLPTYNEGLDVLERSILGSLHVDWPADKLRVWVLDDGKRDWVRDFCEKVGAGYIRRKINNHAKAGNLNNAFDETHGDFIAVLDADFVPFRNFLYRTVGFFANPKIGILQTPQHFFNKDYVQSNLHIYDAAPDDQRLFFDVMMPARDGWNAAFWCGSCSVTRRTALGEIGGVPTESITEDLTTTLVMLRKGYVTRYLNEKLSHGLAPESLPGLLTQRKRWCRGTLQTLFTKNGPFGPGLSVAHRILFFPWHWLFSPFTRMFAFVVPIVFMWTGLPALYVTHYTELINFFLPVYLINIFAALWLAPHHYIPFLSMAINSVEAIQVIPTILKSLFSPFDAGFGVTPKGKDGRPSNFKGNVHLFTFWMCIALLLLTAVGMMINLIPEISPISSSAFFPISALWATLNLFMLIIMVLLSVEHPRNRVDERFSVNKQGLISLPPKGRSKEKQVPIFIKDLSLGGIRLQQDLSYPINLKNDQMIKLEIPNLGSYEAKVLRTDKGIIYLQFENLVDKPRNDLIQYLYTGAFDNKGSLRYGSVFHRLLNRIFGDHAGLYKA